MRNSLIITNNAQNLEQGFCFGFFLLFNFEHLQDALSLHLVIALCPDLLNRYVRDFSRIIWVTNAKWLIQQNSNFNHTSSL